MPKIFFFWGHSYEFDERDSYTVDKNVAFRADYIYYGDLDGSGDGINAQDLAVMRKILLGFANTGACSYAGITADMNTDSQISLTDLVRLKKYTAGMSVTVGAE